MEKVLVVIADKQIIEQEQVEFLQLIHACDFEVEQIFSQTLRQINQKTYIGKGKCEEIALYCESHDIDKIFFHKALTPLQISNLEALWQVVVFDRSDLILEIFAKRAKTTTARLQIESAQLKKQLPRLVGANKQLGRQSSSGKNKGTGEKQLELDRRRINSRLIQTQRELKKLEKQRETQRKARNRSTLPLVSLVGYTNAGKSTIMNSILTYTKGQEDKKVMEKDQLFATLDTSVRRIDLANGFSFLLSDTVGFVQNLPHELIEAFHSTLEEVSYATLLLQVVDISDADYLKQIEVTKDTLNQIQAGTIKMLSVYNQCDKSECFYPLIEEDRIYVCAKEKSSIQLLLQFIQETLEKIASS